MSDPREAADVHIADSLSGLEVPELRDARAIGDIGAGAGFPGLVLAVALPEASVDLIESAGRKTALIERLARAALTGNARAVTARVEDWGRAGGVAGRQAYDVVTARAVGPLAVLAEYAAPLLRENGVLVAWKGAANPDEQTAGSKAALEVGLEAEAVLEVKPWAAVRDRRLYVFRKIAPTPERFPRRPGMAAKRPLA